ncbi:amidohydrolase [Kibdelosporangium philippinense]|uniref:Amidohydrolase n=1 Tax=Kibdelosporangium philippinense TaxID=211113 RepID=A0ABS8ZLF0_9PSEU|nr:amidohydrolase [Kibdelosporangium philippinense]MCE7008625.1 amidohydrolase [Kibdelosporangium philippinense]
MELADFYRDLHEHPELSGHEHRTAERVAQALAPLGYEVTSGVGGTGVVALLRKGDGPTVMVRADMDALPVEEKTDLPYASKVPGVMHACGHDMHVACLVGAARELAKDEWSGTLMLVFQPAEEVARGARAMVADGLFDRFGKPDIVLGQHVGPLPAGMLGYGTGPVMAGSDSVQVTLHGRGGHGSRPETTVDPILMAANVVTRLQGIVAREVPPSETAVITVGKLHAGTKDNIIPDTAELGINMRTYTKQTHDLVRAAIERIVRAESAASGAPKDPEFDWNDSAPVLVSDPEATTKTVAEFARTFGADKVMVMPLITGSEDVGIFGEAAGVPTVFWFWGGLEFDVVVEALRRGGVEALPSNHSSVFAPVLEPTLTTGVQSLRVAALTWLGPAS